MPGRLHGQSTGQPDATVDGASAAARAFGSAAPGRPGQREGQQQRAGARAPGALGRDAAAGGLGERVGRCGFAVAAVVVVVAEQRTRVGLAEADQVDERAARFAGGHGDVGPRAGDADRAGIVVARSGRGERSRSLPLVLEGTPTPRGARPLRQWLVAPLPDLAAVGERLDAVEELLRTTTPRRAGAKILAPIGDLERLTSRVAAKRITPRDLVGLAATLAAVERLRVALEHSAAVLMRSGTAQLDDLPGLRARIAAMLSEDPPLNPRAGGLVQPGYDPLVDELRALTHEGKRYIGELEAAERARTGIN